MPSPHTHTRSHTHRANTGEFTNSFRSSTTACAFARAAFFFLREYSASAISPLCVVSLHLCLRSTSLLRIRVLSEGGRAGHDASRWSSGPVFYPTASGRTVAPAPTKAGPEGQLWRELPLHDWLRLLVLLWGNSKLLPWRHKAWREALLQQMHRS